MGGNWTVEKQKRVHTTKRLAAKAYEGEIVRQGISPKRVPGEKGDVRGRLLQLSTGEEKDGREGGPDH